MYTLIALLSFNVSCNVQIGVESEMLPFNTSYFFVTDQVGSIESTIKSNELRDSVSVVAVSP